MVGFAGSQSFRSMSREMNKMIDQLQRGYFGFAPGETWQPAVNLYETDSAYLVCVDLAGVDKDKIDLELTNQRLTIRGTRQVPTHELTEGCQDDANARKCRIHLMEIDHGAFTRQVEVPVDVSHERIAASYRNGMLWIELPKK